MFIVEADPVAVEVRVRERGFVCPVDGAVLAGWGWARPRRVRGIEGVVRPRRVRCPACGVTHVLLPAVLLVRRADSAARIGAGLRLAARGVGFRRIAVLLGTPADTVRRWLRRARVNAAVVAAMIQAAVTVFDPLARPLAAWPVGGVLGGLVAAVGSLAAALRVRFGAAVTVAPWSSLSLVTGGRVLSPGLGPVAANTSCPLPGTAGGG